jgi:cadmium resistance protein CadD (predicted permease)
VVAGLPAELGVAALAFVSTNIDNVLVATTMVAAAPPARARRIAAGQVIGFAILVGVAAAAAIALFDVPTRALGLLGLVPLALGLRGLVALRHPDAHQRAARRAFGKGVVAAALVTMGAGGDNFAVYIPLFRSAHASGRITTALVFIVGEVLVTLFILSAGRHPRTRVLTTRVGAIAAPVLYCAVGVLVLIEANTFSLLG